MAVSEQTPYKEYIANGVTTSFALGFDCESKDHLIVLIDEIEPVVSAWSLSNGAVVFNAAPENGKKITIQRNTPFSRTTDYQSYNNSFRPPAVNNDLDRVWYKIQELGVKDWLLDLKIQKFRDDVNLTALENTLEEARQIRDDTADSVVEVQGNVAQSQTLLGNTTAQANLAQGYASSANSANAAAQQAAIDVSTAKADVYSALSAQQIAVNNSLTAIAGGHKAYQTLAAAQAAQATLPVNSIVEVTNDGANNGTYQWNGTTLTKSAYDPLTQAKNYTVQSISTLESSILSPSKNLFNKNSITLGKRISNDPAGVIQNSAGWSISDYIPVTAGLSYAVSATQRRVGLAFYDSAKALIAGSYNQTNPAIVTAPVGAAYLVINVDSDTITASKVQVEQSTSVTSYVEFGGLIKDSKISENIVRADELMEFVAKTELDGLVEPLTIKDYDIVVTSPNLYDITKKQVGKLVDSTNGRIKSATGWSCSDFIPVTAGQYYTISYEAKRVGAAFFTTKESAATTSLGYINSLANPLTVQAPVGANWLVVNIDSDVIVSSKVQVEVGSVATAYAPYGPEQLVKRAKVEGLNTILNDLSSELNSLNDRVDLIDQPTTASINLTSGTGIIKFGLLELGVKVFNPVNHTKSSVFNFNNDSYNGKTIRLNQDDVAPVRMMGATIGANHGYSRINLTLASHGKTNADVGSIWTDGTTQWVIIEIISTSVIGVTARFGNIDFPISLPTLIHISGATNTAAFTPTTTTSLNWFPMLKSHTVSMYADGDKITETTINRGFNKSLKVVESYDLMEKSDIVEWLILNGGKAVPSYSAASALNVNNTHEFDKAGGDTLYANFFTYKALSAAQDLMFTQSARLATGVDGSIKYYVPRSVAFTHESVNYDFSKPTAVDNLTITNRIDFTIARTETGKAVPDRLIMLNNSIGYAVGYLPILDADPAVRNTLTSKGIQISNFDAKVYPYLVSGLTTLSAGANYSCVAYRKYFKRPDEIKRIAEYDVRSDFGDFLFLDWDTGDFVDTVILPEYLQNKNFEVVEKTDNVILLTKVATGQISVQIGIVTSNARLILKFK